MCLGCVHTRQLTLVIACDKLALCRMSTSRSTADSSSSRTRATMRSWVVAEADSSGIPLSDEEPDVSTSGQVDNGSFRLVPNDSETDAINRSLHHHSALPKVALNFGQAFAVHNVSDHQDPEPQGQAVLPRVQVPGEGVSRLNDVLQRQERGQLGENGREDQLAQEQEGQQDSNRLGSGQDEMDNLDDLDQMSMGEEDQGRGNEARDEHSMDGIGGAEVGQVDGEVIARQVYEPRQEMEVEEGVEECRQLEGETSRQRMGHCVGQEQKHLASIDEQRGEQRQERGSDLNTKADQLQHQSSEIGQDLLQSLDFHREPSRHLDGAQVPEENHQNPARPISDLPCKRQKRVHNLEPSSADTTEARETEQLSQTANEETNLYTCPLCNQKFHLVAWLREHIQTHKVDGSFPCSYCPKVFDDYASVRRHVRAFHGERKFECHICRKTFITRDKLKQHLVVHDEVKRFQCEQCGKQFGRKDKLREHSLRVHSSKNVSAKIYSKGVNSRNIGNEANEEDSQSVPKSSEANGSFQCIGCRLGFKRRGMLVNHLAKRHPHIPISEVVELNSPIVKTKKSFPCHACHKVYLSSTKRKAHVQKKHPDCNDPKGFESVGQVTSDPSNCGLCHKQYATNAKLMQHVRKAHAQHVPS